MDLNIMNDISNISPTLQSKLYLQEMRRLGRSVYNFGLGENPVNQPSFYVDMLAKHANQKSYTSSEGITPLNDCLKNMYNTENTKYEVLVGNGLKELLFVVQSAFKGKIIHVTPSWVSYSEHIDLLDRMDDLIEIKTSIENDFRINLDVLESVLQLHDQEPKMILLNYPNNPTGTCYSNDHLKDIAELLRKYNCMIFADEIYLNLCYRGDQRSISEFAPELTIRATSVSKDMACGGYRIGWCVFPSNLHTFFETCRNYASRVYSCSAAPIQYATCELLENKEVCKTYIEKTKQLYQHVIAELLPIINKTKLIYPSPSSAWYVFIDFTNYKSELANLGVYDSIDLSVYLMKNHNIITVAGQHFRDDSLALRFSLVDFSFDVETEQFEDLDIENMKRGFHEMVSFLSSLS